MNMTELRVLSRNGSEIIELYAIFFRNEISCIFD